MLVESTRGASLLAPPSVHWEVGNAFSAMLKQKRVTLAEALKALEVDRRIPTPFAEVELDEALEVAGEASIYACDAYVIRCAQKYSAPPLTLDRELARAAIRVGVDVVDVWE